MKILALDQSITETGYWIEDTINGVIKSKLKGQIERIANIRNIIKGLTIVHLFDTIIMEGYSFGSSNSKFTFTAGELGGMIKLFCFDNQINLVIVPPTLLKKFICGKGNVKKEQMLLQVYKKYGKEFDNNNIADAFGLHKFYEQYIKWRDQDIYLPKEFTKNDIECFIKLHGLEKDKE